MNNFYKVKNDNIIELCNDLRALFYDVTTNPKIYNQYSGNSVVFKEWNYVQENYDILDTVAGQIPLSQSISFFKGRDFFTHDEIYPHSHNTKYGWGLLFGLENCKDDISTQFFKEKDTSTPIEHKHALKTSNSTEELTYQRSILTKSLHDLELIDKFMLSNNEVYLINGNTYHFPIYEGNNYNIETDRLVAHWYVKNDDFNFLSKELCL